MLVLASASPRRRELLARLGVGFVVCPSHIPEVVPPGPPAAAIAALALAKARAVARTVALVPPPGGRAQLPSPGPLPPAEGPPAAGARAGGSAGHLSGAPQAIVLAADTEVVIDGRPLGKPTDRADAARMLRVLRGRVHEVITAVALVGAGPIAGREETAAVVTRVRMAEYDEAAIEWYVATGEPMDKAGAYAVQGMGARLVAGVEGCYTNVVGLPLTTTRRLLEGWGVLAGGTDP